MRISAQEHARAVDMVQAGAVHERLYLPSQYFLVYL